MDNEFFLLARDIHKRFGAVQALRGVDFEVRYGEVVGLVGDNGAGKSTLMKILAGALPPDRGEIWIEGKRANISSPHDSRRYGIEMVYQDLALAGNLDAPANVFMGREKTHRFWKLTTPVLHRREMEKVTGELLLRLGVQLPNLRQRVRYLSGGQRQAVAIARTLLAQAKLVIMDEPTAALGVSEAERVLDLIRRLKEEGISVVFITHRLPHIFAVCDRIVVLRAGKRVGERTTCETTMEEITQLIVGGKTDVKYERE
ncbi:MAG: ATP-binding cassette domain-containing protein [Candidatus Bipolaricaulota bacterium]|nr:ATP-binding cassette domain-containing protein [Candidatus Bipolaricaulota bacterium]MDW8126169.1 ATP-binding cassette domain-containing protein [Candidatus Bipolaricaulota bacterium]